MINQAYITDIINAAYYLMMTLSSVIMLSMVVFGLMAIANQRSMQTGNQSQSLATRGGWYTVAGGLFAGKVGTIMSEVTRDMLSVESRGWSPLQTNSNPIQFMGDFIIYAFLLFGIGLLLKAAMMMPKIRTGEATLGSILLTIVFGVLMGNIEAISNEIAMATPFNPLALFSPGSTVIQI